MILRNARCNNEDTTLLVNKTVRSRIVGELMDSYLDETLNRRYGTVDLSTLQAIGMNDAKRKLPHSPLPVSRLLF